METNEMKLVVQKVTPNMVIHWVDEEAIWASSNYSLYISKDEGNSFNKMIDLEVPFWSRILGRFRLSNRALRLGVRSLMKLKSGTILVAANWKLFRLTDNGAEVTHVFKRGPGPLREGWCQDDGGNCYMAEYFLNNRRKAAVDLLKSTDDGRTWKVIRSLHNIRHIHCVQYDPFSKKIWLGTGDRGEETSISFSEDEGESWTVMGRGDQMFRAVGLLFTEDYIYWGSDVPTRQNYIYRYSRGSGQIERLAAVDGTVHYSTILGNGIKLFATTAEGNSEGKNPEWDRKAHIWASKDGTHWEDIVSWEKDFWPYILGYGTVLFAHGQRGNNLYFTTRSLKRVDGMLTQAQLFVED